MTPSVPGPTRETEIIWLEPMPGRAARGRGQTPLPDRRPQYAARESISLAFVTILQTLPPRQRACLVLRDVMGFRASEVAEMLESSEESVTSALKRARATLADDPELRQSPPPPPNSPEERELLRKLTIAYESSDVDALVALMTEDVWMRMPPVPLEYQGREVTRQFLRSVAFTPGREFRVLQTRANLQPAFGIYPRDETTGLYRAYGVIVFTLSGDAVSAITRFDNSMLAASSGCPGRCRRRAVRARSSEDDLGVDAGLPHHHPLAFDRDPSASSSLRWRSPLTQVPSLCTTRHHGRPSSVACASARPAWRGALGERSP